MKKIIISLVLMFSVYAYSSNSQVCSDSEGSISVVDGNVSIKDGIGDVGPVTSKVIVAEISESHESCVEGPNYLSTFVTVENITFDIEENVSGAATVICTQTLSGIVPAGTECNPY